MTEIPILALTLVRNTPDLVEDMYRQIPEVRVVDNGSDDPVPGAWLRIEKNRYFSGGWNLAVQEAFRRHRAQWVWLLNSDVREASMRQLYRLVEVAKANNAVMASPAILGSSHQHMIIRSNIPVTWIDCTAPLVNVDWFLANQGFDEHMPGWGADIDLCYRTSGTKLVVGEIALEHEWGQTSRRCNDTTMYRWLEVKQYLTHKHGTAIHQFVPSFFFQQA